MDVANCMRGMDMPGCTKAQAEIYAPAPVSLDLSWSGTLGAGTYTCADGAGCQNGMVVPGVDDAVRDAVNGTLLAVELTLTWTATTSATSTLRFGVMTMDHCYGCNVTMLDEDQGSSSLVLSATNLHAHVSSGNWFHSFVWNPTVDQSLAGAGWIYATPDQPFTVTGKATIAPRPHLNATAMP